MSFDDNYRAGLNCIVEVFLLILKSPFALLGWLFKKDEQ